MRKSLLIAAAAVMTATAVSAQPQVLKVSAVRPAQANAMESVASTPAAYATMATEAELNAAPQKVAGKATPKAWYNRPRGAFYRSNNKTGGAFYAPMIFAPAYRPVTYPNASTNATSVTWTYTKYNTTASKFDTLTSTDNDLTATYIWESGYAPTITATDGTNTDSYHLFGLYYNSTDKSNKNYDGFNEFCLDPYAAMNDGSTNAYEAYLSPGYCGAVTREGSIPGNYYLTGASGDPNDENNTSGKWFGKNYSGWNAIGIYIEKPEIPYGLRGIHANYTSGKFAGKATLTATVYSVTKLPNYNSTRDSLAFGDVIAKGTVDVNTSNAEYGCLDIPLVEEEDGLVTEVEPTIDGEIAVVLSGYDAANITDFSLTINNDRNDEGYGDTGWMLVVDPSRDASGKPIVQRQLSKFFSGGGVGCANPSLYIDAEWPMLTYWYTAVGGNPYESTDSWQAPAEGGSHNVEYWSTKASDYWTVTQADGSELPNWLTYNLNDSTADNAYTSHTTIKYTAAALPSTVKGRSCKVLISYPGAKAYYTVSQGEVEGINDVKDANKQVASRRYFNVAGQEAAEPFEGVNIVETTFTDGTKSTEKVVR